MWLPFVFSLLSVAFAVQSRPVALRGHLERAHQKQKQIAEL
jgi:hypothetical protein